MNWQSDFVSPHSMQQQQHSDQQHQHLQAAGPGHHHVNTYHHQASAQQPGALHPEKPSLAAPLSSPPIPRRAAARREPASCPF